MVLHNFVTLLPHEKSP